jgi:hypothetical protein
MSEYAAETQLSSKTSNAETTTVVAVPSAKRSHMRKSGVSEDEYVDQTSESFYHTVGYFFVLKQDTSGFVYFVILVITLVCS